MQMTAPGFVKKYPVFFWALLVVLLSFPIVLFTPYSLVVTDAVRIDGSIPKTASLYPEINGSATKGHSDAGGALWQSESKIAWMKHVLETGESPYWNPYQGAGTYGPEGLVDIKFSVITFVSALLGASSTAINAALLLIFLVGAACLIKLCTKYLGLPIIAGVCASILYIYNGVQISGLATNYTQAYMLFPLYGLTLFALLKTPSLVNAVLAAAAGALVLSITFMPTTVLCMASTIFISLGFLWQQGGTHQARLKLLGLLILVSALSLLLTAFIYLPVLKALVLSGEFANYSERVFYPAKFNALLSLFSPKHLWYSYQLMDHFLWDPNHPAYNGNVVFHIGIVAGFITAFLCSKQTRFTATLIAALAVFIIAIGRAFDVIIVSDFVDILPFFGNLGQQYIWMAVMVAAPFVVAFGVQSILQNPHHIPKAPYAFLAIVFGLFIYLLFVYPLNNLNSDRFKNIGVFVGLLGFLLVYLKVLRHHPLIQRYLPYCIAALLFVEMSFYANHNRAESVSIYTNPPGYVSFLQENIGNHRLLNIGPYGLPGDMPSAYQIQDVSNMTLNGSNDYIQWYYDYFMPKEYKFNSFLTFVRATDQPKLYTDMLNFVGVKYVLINQYTKVWESYVQELGFKKAHAEPGAIAVYENPSVWPRAFVSYGKENTNQAIRKNQLRAKHIHTAEITDYHHDAVEINVTAKQDGMLILTDVWHPDWRASIDDKPVAVEKVFDAFRGIAIEKGDHTVRFYYDNKAVYWGVRISMGVAVLLSIALLYGVILRRRA